MKNTRKLSIVCLLAVLFASPGIAAYLLFYHPNWLSAPKTNYGELLETPVFLADLPQKKWQLIFWSPNDCQESCINTMDKLARVRLALGRRLYEVEAILLIKDNALISSKNKKILSANDIRTVILKDSTASLKDTAQFYIANPQGYLVLTYADETKPNAIYHDIKRLLKTQDS